MADRVLYFPYISVPDNEWFTRVLLYWDGVGSIVPSPYAESLDRLSPYMADLVRAELVRPVIPGEHEGELYEAMLPFFTFLDSDPVIAERVHRGLGGPAAARGRARAGTVVQLHGEKLGDVIAEELAHRGLARPARASASGRGWYDVESRTANAFMWYLAAVLGGMDDVDMTPITDDLGSLDPFSAVPDRHHRTEIARELRMGILERVLPGPTRGISVSELASFKEKHGDLTGRFRRLVEDRVLDLALVEDDAVRAAKLELFEEELSEGIHEIQSRMRANAWRSLDFGLLCGVVGAAIPVGAAVGTGALPIAAAGVPGLAQAIHSALGVVRSRKDFRRDPLAYAALAQERLA